MPLEDPGPLLDRLPDSAGTAWVRDGEGLVGWGVAASFDVTGDERFIAVIFHELAHQQFYVKDDTEFNESFASFVEQEGTRQWRVARGLAAIGGDQGQQREQFIRLVLASRERLQAIYAGPLDDAQKRTAKQLYADLVALGFDGSYTRVAAFVKGFGRLRTKASSAGTRGPQALFYG